MPKINYFYDFISILMFHNFIVFMVYLWLKNIIYQLEVVLIGYSYSGIVIQSSYQLGLGFVDNYTDNHSSLLNTLITIIDSDCYDNIIWYNSRRNTPGFPCLDPAGHAWQGSKPVSEKYPG